MANEGAAQSADPTSRTFTLEVEGHTFTFRKPNFGDRGKINARLAALLAEGGPVAQGVLNALDGDVRAAQAHFEVLMTDGPDDWFETVKTGGGDVLRDGDGQPVREVTIDHLPDFGPDDTDHVVMVLHGKLTDQLATFRKADRPGRHTGGSQT